MANPNYYALIPASIRYDKNLSPSEKLFYAEITALTQMNGKCFASNSYFSGLYNVANSTISLWVSNLAKNGHIDIDYIYDGKQIIKRYISITNPMGLHQISQELASQESEGVVRKSDGGSQKIGWGYSENQKDNNTLTESNTTLTESNKKETAYTPEFETAWKAYGCHGGKKKAYAVWKKLPKEERTKAVEAIPMYLSSIEPKYKKYFEGYLNSGLYESTFTPQHNGQAPQSGTPLYHNLL